MQMSKENQNIIAEKNGSSWLYAILFLIVVTIIIGIYRNGDLKINSIDFIGNYYAEPELLLEKADINTEQNPDSLDYASILNNIKAVPYVKDAQVFVEPNGNIRFTISERQPIALLIQSNKRSYVDEEGIQLPILKGKTVNVPLVYGFGAENYTDTLNSNEFTQIKDLLIAAKANEFGWATLSELTYTKNDGVVAISHENGVKLIFGEYNFETKLENWEAFYSEIVREKGISKIQQVDLRFLNQVVTREL